MSRQVFKLIILAVILGALWFAGQPQKGPRTAPAPVTGDGRAFSARTGAAAQTWGRPDTLPDHFARHGRDFNARDPEDYAAKAAAFLQRAKATGLPAKRAADGSLRVYDPDTGTFGAYNSDGTTKTFFKPGNPGYFDHQTGTPVDLRTGR